MVLRLASVLSATDGGACDGFRLGSSGVKALAARVSQVAFCLSVPEFDKGCPVLIFIDVATRSRERWRWWTYRSTMSQGWMSTAPARWQQPILLPSCSRMSATDIGDPGGSKWVQSALFSVGQGSILSGVLRIRNAMSGADAGSASTRGLCPSTSHGTPWGPNPSPVNSATCLRAARL
eukprot:942175-Rhodomonas_salina.3